MVLSRETADLDGDGFVDALHATLNESISDAAVTAVDWDVAGVTGEDLQIDDERRYRK